MNRKWLWAALPLSLLAIDLLIKQWILVFFGGEPYPVSTSHQVIGDFFRLTYVQNRGITFGIFRDVPPPYSYIILTATSTLALGVLAYFYKSANVLLKPPAHTPAKIALLSIFGGALGNIVDRMLRGFVVDYLDFGINQHRWYTFNFADICVVVGCITMAILMIFFEVKPVKKT